MTGFNSVRTIMDAMKIGVLNFVQKPCEIEKELKFKVEIDYLRHTQPDIYSFGRTADASGTLQRIRFTTTRLWPIETLT